MKTKSRYGFDEYPLIAQHPIDGNISLRRHPNGPVIFDADNDTMATVEGHTRRLIAEDAPAAAARDAGWIASELFHEPIRANKIPGVALVDERAGRWIPVSEPPKFRDAVWCLTRRDGKPTVIDGRHDHHGWWLLHDGCAYSFGEYDYESPTHWQEIRVPQPPAIGDDK